VTYAGAAATEPAPQPVVIKDFDMPFGSMVSFIVKWTIAAIPALLILFVLFAVVSAAIGGFFASLLHH